MLSTVYCIGTVLACIATVLSKLIKFPQNITLGPQWPMGLLYRGPFKGANISQIWNEFEVNKIINWNQCCAVGNMKACMYFNFLLVHTWKILQLAVATVLSLWYDLCLITFMYFQSRSSGTSFSACGSSFFSNSILNFFWSKQISILILNMSWRAVFVGWDDAFVQNGPNRHWRRKVSLDH